MSGADLRPSIDDALAAFGVAATVTRPAPDNTPIETTGFWVSPLEEAQPYGTAFQRRDPRRVFVLSRIDVPTLPPGTVIEAAEYDGDTVKTWRVDTLDRAVEPDSYRAVVSQVSA